MKLIFPRREPASKSGGIQAMASTDPQFQLWMIPTNMVGFLNEISIEILTDRKIASGPSDLRHSQYQEHLSLQGNSISSEYQGICLFRWKKQLGQESNLTGRSPVDVVEHHFQPYSKSSRFIEWIVRSRVHFSGRDIEPESFMFSIHGRSHLCVQENLTLGHTR